MRKQIICALAILTVALMARTAYIVHAQTATAAELRMQLADSTTSSRCSRGSRSCRRPPNSRVRMIQVVNGAVTVDGDTLTAAQLRDRLGADAATIVQLTYLSAAEQRQLAVARDRPPRSRRRLRRRLPPRRRSLHRRRRRRRAQ